jgi:Cd2+/Zn2+-exporting ATPase
VERIFVPIVLVGAPLFTLGLLASGHPLQDSVLRGLSLLVAASPCALAISTPAAVLSAVARAARGGVLVKGGTHLDALGKLRVVAFDKTGTLTENKPTVQGVVPAPGVSEARLLATAAAAEGLSGHPLARAVVAAAAARGLPLGHAEDLVALHGKGLRAVVDGVPVWIGNPALFQAEGAAPPPPPVVLAALEAEQRAGRTAMIVAAGVEVLGVIGVADTLRGESADTVRALHGLGIRRVVMLSGDHEIVARSVAAKVGIDDVRAPLLPEEKLLAVRELARSGGVAMVGDGVNDAPALATATVGISLGGAGSDVALETADVVLMADNLSRLPFAVSLAQATRRVVRQNLSIAIGVSALLVLASVMGWVEISEAVVLHEGSTLVVVFNGLRLLRWRED